LDVIRNQQRCLWFLPQPDLDNWVRNEVEDVVGDEEEEPDVRQVEVHGHRIIELSFHSSLLEAFEEAQI
jgi:hypothetical protein